MSKKIALVVSVLILVMMGGCKKNHDTNYNVTPYYKFMQEDRGNAVTKDGVYYKYLNQDGAYMLRYIDYTTEKDVYVCNRPNCEHNNQDCNAYYGNVFNDEQISMLFTHGNVLYVTRLEPDINAAGISSFSLWKQGMDGESREHILTINNELLINMVIIQEKMYFVTQCVDENVMKEFENTSFNDVGDEDYAYLSEHMVCNLWVFDFCSGKASVVCECIGGKELYDASIDIIPSDVSDKFYMLLEFGDYNDRQSRMFYYDIKSSEIVETMDELGMKNIYPTTSFGNSGCYIRGTCFYFMEKSGDKANFYRYNKENEELSLLCSFSDELRVCFFMDEKLFFDLGFGNSENSSSLEYKRFIFMNLKDNSFYVGKGGPFYPKYSSGKRGVVDYTDYYAIEILNQEFEQYEYVVTDMQEFYQNNYKKYENEFGNTITVYNGE